MSEPSDIPSDIHKPDDSEESLGQLLREAGARDMPSAELMRDVREAVHMEWQSVVMQRRSRNRYVGYGVAASVAVAALATTIGLKLATTPALPIASVGWQPLRKSNTVKLGKVF